MTTFWDPRGPPHGPKLTGNAHKITIFSFLHAESGKYEPILQDAGCRMHLKPLCHFYLPSLYPDTLSLVCNPRGLTQGPPFPCPFYEKCLKKNRQNQLWRAIPRINLYLISLDM